MWTASLGFTDETMLMPYGNNNISMLQQKHNADKPYPTTLPLNG